jgi:hypothetical protein
MMAHPFLRFSKSEGMAFILKTGRCRFEGLFSDFNEVDDWNEFMTE